MMRTQKTPLQLTLLISIISIAVTSAIIFYIYQAGLSQQQQRMMELVTIDSQLIESVARYDQEIHQEFAIPGNATEATLAQVREGLVNSDLRVKSERIYLIKENQDSILIAANNHSLQQQTIAKNDPRAALFIKVLNKGTGTLIDYDIFNNKVLAAYSYIPALDHTLVAKINKEDLQESYIFSAILVFVIATLLINFFAFKLLRYAGKINSVIEEKEERLRLILESSGEPIYGIDLNGKCTFANPACAATLGYLSVDELIGQNMHQLIHHSYENGSCYPEDQCKIRHCFDPEEPNHASDEVFWKKDGSPLHVDYCAYPILRDGKNIGIVVTFTDITEKRQQAQALIESENRYRSLFEDAFVGIAHVSLKGEFVEINQRFCEIIGYSKNEMQQITFMKITHPDDLSIDLDNANALLTGQIKRYTMEKRYLHKDGHIVWVELMVNLLRDEYGQPKHFVSAINDITRRKESERNLQRAQEAHSQAEQITHFGNWDWDILTGDLSWTDEIYRIFGVEPQQFPATYEAFLETIHPDDKQAVIDAVSASVADANVEYNIEHHIIRPNGDVRYVHEQGRVYRNEQGEPIRMIGTVHDITDRKLTEIELNLYKNQLENLVNERTTELIAAQDELVKKERLATLGQLTATVSHELRNPLAAIRSSLYVVEQLNSNQEEKLINAIQRVVRNVERCDHIIDELLDFTRSSTLSIEALPIESWLKRLLEEQQFADDITLNLQFHCNDCHVEIDEGKLQRAIINIVDNACQAMREQPEKTHQLKIAVDPSDDQVKITISDNGPGIKAEVMPKIFEPLFSTKGFGTGLGMPTVKQIIDQHNGDIRINSTLGDGTDVIIKLPLHQSNLALSKKSH